MPSADTFSIGPINRLLKWYLKDCAVVVDPFARNSRFGTITNDLNPETEATYHMDAEEFGKKLVSEGVVADAVLFDPPYSSRQIAEVYQGVGRQVTMYDTQRGPMHHAVKSSLDKILKVGGVAICFGWNSGGFGSDRLYELEEILLVPHGAEHNDTIVTVERKIQGQLL